MDRQVIHRIAIVLGSLALAAVVTFMAVVFNALVRIQCIGDHVAYCHAHQSTVDYGLLLGPGGLIVLVGVVAAIRSNFLIVAAIALVLVPVAIFGPMIL